MQLDPKLSFKDTLQQAMDAPARITVYLGNGETLEGNVGGVADHHVVLSSLANRDFYDAVIRIKEISAIEIRARDS